MKCEKQCFNCVYFCVCFQSLKELESEKLQVQIQAYLDNVFDVGALLEDAESKSEIMEHIAELQETNAEVKYTHTHTAEMIESVLC